jgi:hypothetical protein
LADHGEFTSSVAVIPANGNRLTAPGGRLKPACITAGGFDIKGIPICCCRSSAGFQPASAKEAGRDACATKIRIPGVPSGDKGLIVFREKVDHVGATQCEDLNYYELWTNSFHSCLPHGIP